MIKQQTITKADVDRWVEEAAQEVWAAAPHPSRRGVPWADLGNDGDKRGQCLKQFCLGYVRGRIEAMLYPETPFN
jgi:hypothetical protein